MSVTLFFFLLVKHFICDFALQGRFNKDMPHDKHKLFTSKKGHLHAGDHGIGTAFIFMCVCIVFLLRGYPLGIAWAIVLFGLFDYICHLVIDWLKNNFCRANGWTFPNREFWIVTSVDQTLHALTYLAIVILFDIYFV